VTRRRLRLSLLRAAGRLKPPRPRTADPQRILAIRPDHLGDLILAAPAVAALRAGFPAASITAWLGPWGEPVWRDYAAVDAIETCSFPGIGGERAASPLAPYALALRQARRLRGRFDLAIDLRFDYWWGAMAACWAGIPVAGYDLPECRPFLAQAVTYQPRLHETDQGPRLVEAVAGRPLGGFPQPPLWAEVEPPAGLPEGAVAIHPGTRVEVKQWDEARWAGVASELAGEAPVVFTSGSEEELALARRIQAGMSAPACIAPLMSLPELAAFYRRCRLALGPDSGPLHVARSVGTPTVTLFGPTDPGLFGPRPGNGDEVLRLPWRCIPCGRLDYTPGELAYHLCVKLIEPEQVIAAARRVLALRK
jgi:ADP-heptose:LPS heptosyltransferase